MSRNRDLEAIYVHASEIPSHDRGAYDHVLPVLIPYRYDRVHGVRY